ncbi:MAG: NADH-quinone oxidoreductase subunit J [Candidatus Dasytiphilus stammeri]
MTILLITNKNPMHALLCMLITILAIAGMLFSLGADLAASLEIIAYAGAIMVIFVFVVMIVNSDKKCNIERPPITKKLLFLGIIVLATWVWIIFFFIQHIPNYPLPPYIINVQAIGKLLFSTYIVLIESISLLLLAGLIVAFKIGCKVR